MSLLCSLESQLGCRCPRERDHLDSRLFPECILQNLYKRQDGLAAAFGGVSESPVDFFDFVSGHEDLAFPATNAVEVA